MHSYLCFACFFISVSIASEAADPRPSSSEMLEHWRHGNAHRLKHWRHGNAHLSKSEDGQGEVAVPCHLTLADSDVNHHFGQAVRLGDERGVTRCEEALSEYWT